MRVCFCFSRSASASERRSVRERRERLERVEEGHAEPHPARGAGERVAATEERFAATEAAEAAVGEERVVRERVPPPERLANFRRSSIADG